MTDERLSDGELSEIAIRYKHDGRGTVLGYRAKQEILSLRTTLAAEQAKLEKAREALKPFAEVGEDYMMLEACDMLDGPIMWRPSLEQIRIAATTLKDIA